MIVKTAVLLLLASLLIAPSTRAGCVVDDKTTIPLDIANGTITVPLEVNGIAATFILDTGAYRSLVTREAVHRLRLARDQWVATTSRGLGGMIERTPNANPRSLTLGGVPLVRRTVNHDASLTVGLLGRTHIGNLEIDGLLGRDFLALFDLDLDVPKRRLTLYHVLDCVGRFLPWRSGYTSIPATILFDNSLIVPVSLDAKPLRALLDTGAGTSMVFQSGMFRLNLQPANLGNDPAGEISGIGSQIVTMRRHAFTVLRVGDQTTATPVIWVAPMQLMPIVDMLLGSDWLAKRHIWVSFATRQLFLAAP